MLGGCDGDDQEQAYSVDASTTVKVVPIPKSRFIAEVNRFCRDAWPIVTENFVKYSHSQEPGLSKRERFADAVQLSLLAGIDFHIFDSIYRLGASAEETLAVEDLIGSMQAAVEQGQKRLLPISTRGQVVRLFADYNRRAARYGLAPVCQVSAARLRPLRLAPQTGAGGRVD